METFPTPQSGNSATESDKFKYLWMPFTHYRDFLDYPPIVIKNGSGIYVYDIQGKGYIDAIASWWLTILGHNHPKIIGCIKAQLEKLEHVIMAGFISETTLELTNLLGSMLPSGLNRIFYSDNGSTAVEVALKIALQYHFLRGDKNRTEFVAFSGAYHGDTLGAMSVGMISQYHGLFHQQFKKQNFTQAPYCYRCPVGKEKAACSAECMDSLEAILNERGEKIAAFIFEPMVQGAAGMRVYPPKVLQKAFALCQKYNILTIGDEIAMGFGRTGKLFACNHADVVPDIMCLAKGLTGGHLPLSATVVKEELFGEFCGDYTSERIFNHGHSFTGNPLAASAACAALNIIKDQNIPESMNETMAFFQEKLDTFNEYDIAGDIRTLGFVGAIEFVQDRQSKKRLPPEKRFCFHVARNAIESGLLLRPLGDTIYFMPPFIVQKDEIENMIFLTHQAIRKAMDEQLTDI